MNNTRNKLSTLNSQFLTPAGQTVIELLVALSAAVIIITGVTVTVISTLSNAQYSKNEVLATKYSQEGLEIVRQIRDSDYSTFSRLNGTFCLIKGATSLSAGTCTSPNVDNFIRSVQIQQNAGCSANGAKVIVTASWTDGKCQPGIFCNKVQQDSCLSTVNPVQAP